MRRVPAPLQQPWAISEEGLRLVLAVWSRGELFPDVRERALQERDGEPLENAHQTTVRDGVAIIPVCGPLFRRASLFTEISAATDYGTIRKDLATALADPAAKAIILEIDSPGGEVNGCGELAQAIYAARGVKPIVAYVGGTGASAAYWIASAADKIVAAETAILGSIGVRTALVDDSKRDAMEGIREIELVSSQSPGKRDAPVDDEVVARAQAHIDELASVFIAAVARHRGVSTGVVQSRFGQGDVLIGQRAVEAGLADELGTFEQTLKQLAASSSVPPSIPTGGSKMKTKRVARAEAAPEPEKKPEGGEDMAPEGAEGEDCAKCEGTGEVDGEKCEDCDGTGKTEAKAEDEPMGDAEDGDGDEDDEEKKHDEQASRAELAKMAGLPPTASLSRIKAALAAKTVPLSEAEKRHAALAAEVAALKADNARREKAERQKAAAAFAKRALAEGRTTEEKVGRVEKEYAERGEAAAEDLLFPKGTFAALKRHTGGGHPLAGDRLPPVNLSEAGEQPQQATGVGGLPVYPEIGAELSAEANALAAKEKIPFQVAMQRVAKDKPALAGRITRR